MKRQRLRSHIAEWKKPVWKVYLMDVGFQLYDILERANCRDNKKVCGCGVRLCGCAGDDQAGHGILGQRCSSVFCSVMGTHDRLALAKMRNAQHNHKHCCLPGLRLATVYQFGVISRNRYWLALMGAVSMVGGGVGGWRTCQLSALSAPLFCTQELTL